ncbi:MAG TPA: aldo/keto reductase [Candidatus Gracilibacteria bacterium]
MQYTRLSTTDTKVSSVCLGTMSFGAHVNEETARAVMDKSLELGINFFDTAELYAIPPCKETHGLTEEIIGRWMRDRGNRFDIVLATKVVGPTRGAFDSYIRGGETGFDRKNIMHAVEDSLKRLQTDYIDLYQLHWPDRNVPKFGQRNWVHATEEQATPILETLQVLAELQKSGKVRHFGLSNETPWGTLEFLRLARENNLPRMVSVQNNYSLLTRSYETAMAEISMREDIGLLPYSPLGFGALGGRYLDGKKPKGGRFTCYPQFATRYRTPQVEGLIKRYKALAESHQITLPQLALAFVYAQPFVTSTIIGPSNVEQLVENVGALDIKLPKEILAGIEEIHEACPNICP